MANITVSTAVLRQKAQRIRAIADQGLAQHHLYWGQMNNTKDQMPQDLRNSHATANDPWHQAIQTHYSNYYDLATHMEQAADWYDAHEGDTTTDLTVK